MLQITRTFVVVLAAASIAACTPQGAAPDSTAMIAEARALDERFVKAVNAADLEGVMSLYWNSPEVVLYPPDGLEARGYDAVREAWRNTFTAMPAVQAESVDPKFLVAGDTVVSWGLYKLTPAPGAPAMDGRFTVVAGQRDGKWVWIFDHGSFPLPPPPAPEVSTPPG